VRKGAMILETKNNMEILYSHPKSRTGRVDTGIGLARRIVEPRATEVENLSSLCDANFGEGDGGVVADRFLTALALHYWMYTRKNGTSKRWTGTVRAVRGSALHSAPCLPFSYPSTEGP
jgi:hypothetical protein